MHSVTLSLNYQGSFVPAAVVEAAVGIVVVSYAAVAAPAVVFI